MFCPTECFHFVIVIAGVAACNGIPITFTHDKRVQHLAPFNDATDEKDEKDQDIDNGESNYPYRVAGGQEFATVPGEPVWFIICHGSRPKNYVEFGP